MIDCRNTDALTLWGKTAYLTILALAFTMDTFTSDEIWERLEMLPQHPEPRALGGIVNSAKSAGIIEETGTYLKSKRAACHKRPIAVYRSLMQNRASGDLPENVLPFAPRSAGSLLSTG